MNDIELKGLPDIELVTPVVDDTGKVKGVILHISILKRWNSEGIAVGGLGGLISELEKIGC
jgi:hypothetical protein